MTSKMMEYFNRAPRIGLLSTVAADGTVDVAVSGSPHMTGEQTGILGSGTNRTLANLRGNPHAVHMIMEPGQSILDWKGVRVYMRLREIATSGPAFDTYMSGVAAAIGKEAASMIHALATFEVAEVRSVPDLGQG